MSLSSFTSRLTLASTALRNGSVKAIDLTSKEKTGKNVQASWGSAMRR